LPTSIEIWAGYAKDRFESASKRVDEFRNWARQLGAAIGVVIGLELTLLGRMFDLRFPIDRGLRDRCLLALLGALAIQSGLLFKLLRTGYVHRTIVGPESPVVLSRHVLAENDQETQRMIGAYYAKAHEQFHTLSETLGRSVGVATRIFAWSIVLFLAGVGLLVAVAARRL
jgi:hypothetical protein